MPLSTNFMHYTTCIHVICMSLTDIYASLPTTAVPSVCCLYIFHTHYPLGHCVHCVGSAVGKRLLKSIYSLLPV